jgi:hypothetical protein
MRAISASAIIWHALPAAAALAQQPAGEPPHEQRSFRAVIVPHEGDGRTDVHGLSFGLFGDRVGRTKGVQLASIYAQVEEDLVGAQLSVAFNFVDGSFRGSQLTGFANFAREGHGLQIAGGLNVAERFHGAQLAAANSVDEGFGVQIGLFNSARQLEGVRLGLTNGAEELRGAEVGLLNAGSEVYGLQVGLLNVPCIPLVSECPDTRQTRGVELGLVNVAEAAGGFQLGGVNVARKARGFQLGIVNMAAKSEGESLALINLIGDGLHELALYTTDIMGANLELKLGARHLYTGLIASYQPGDEPAPGPERFRRGSRRFGLGLGVGWRAYLGGRWLEFVEVEVSGTELAPTLDPGWRGHPLISSFRIQVPVPMARHVRLLVGVAASVAIASGGADADIGPRARPGGGAIGWHRRSCVPGVPDGSPDLTRGPPRLRRGLGRIPDGPGVVFGRSAKVLIRSAPSC